MESIISSTPLRFSVGPKKREFVVHSAAIASQSVPLHDLVASDAAKANHVVLETVEEQTFVLFCEYVYTGDYNLKIGASAPLVPDTSPQPNGVGMTQAGSQSPSEKKKDKKKDKKKKKKAAASEAEQPGLEPTSTPGEMVPGVGLVRLESPLSPAPMECTPYSEMNGKHHGEPTAPDNEQESQAIVSDYPEPEPEPESGVLSPSPSLGRESLWNVFKSKTFFNPNLPPTSPPYKPTECRTPGHILLLHAKVYLLAEYYTVAKLVSVSLDKLHQALLEFEVSDDTVEDIVQLFRFSFEADTPDLLRSLLSLFAECYVEELWKSKSFRDLVTGHGYLSERVIGSLLTRVKLGDFAVERKTIFPYIQRKDVDWKDLGNKLGDDLKSVSRGGGTALWDAIGYAISTTPRNTKYRKYKPELVIFTDGQDNRSSEHTLHSVGELLKNPGIAHAHITIIDASEGGNASLQAICKPVQHCSFLEVKASQEAVQRAFTEVVTAITKRLTVTIESNDLAGTLSGAFSKLKIGLGTLPLAITMDGGEDGGDGTRNTEGGERGRRRGRGGGRRHAKK